MVRQDSFPDRYTTLCCAVNTIEAIHFGVTVNRTNTVVGMTFMRASPT
jgi:hypothetical protein